MTLATVPFKTEFAVDMTCQNVSINTSVPADFTQCVKAVSGALGQVEELEKKRVTITGRTPPSQLLSALKSTQRQVLVRGASAADPTAPSQAAVAILESPLPVPASVATTTSRELADRQLPGMNEDEFTQKVFGIARFVQIAPKSVFMDLTIRVPPPANVGLDPARSAYEVYVSTTGNVLDPPATTGKPFLSLGRIEADKDGYGDLFKEVDGELWEWVGRGCVVEAVADKAAPAQSTIGRIFAGVVARSAGLWGNDKTVCACSGRTMWEEGREMEQKSML